MIPTIRSQLMCRKKKLKDLSKILGAREGNNQVLRIGLDSGQERIVYPLRTFFLVSSSDLPHNSSIKDFRWYRQMQARNQLIASC